MKQRILSVTKDDFEWQFFRGSGAGGQNRNKRDTACRCIHRPSGAVGESQDERSQAQNRKTAFLRCVKSNTFQAWLRATSAAIAVGHESIEKQVNETMRPENLRVEYFTPEKDSLC
jgi:protein subunit release factor A